jgi:hypothetical protein
MKLSAIGKATAVSILFAAGCSQGDHAASVLAEQRVRLASDQDARCNEAVKNDLAPGSMDYGVVSSVAAAKDAARSYWRIVLAKSDVPVEDLSRRPLIAELKDGVWSVTTRDPEGADDSKLGIQICQSNGKVLVINRTI